MLFCSCYYYFNSTNLRSVERHDMLVPSTRTQLGRQSFHVTALAVWNELPLHLRSSSISHGQFRAGLKTISSHRPTRTPLRTFVEERIILHLHWVSLSYQRVATTFTSCVQSAYFLCVIKSSTTDLDIANRSHSA